MNSIRISQIVKSLILLASGVGSSHLDLGEASFSASPNRSSVLEVRSPETDPSSGNDFDLYFGEQFHGTSETPGAKTNEQNPPIFDLVSPIETETP